TLTVRTGDSMTTNIQIMFYSMYGHIYKMAEAVASGARAIGSTDVSLYQVPELVPEDVLEKSGAKAARQAFAHIPIAKVDQLPDADAILFGTGTRYGMMTAQMRNFLDQTGSLWMKGALVGKVGSVFTSTAAKRPRSPVSTPRCCTMAWSSSVCRTPSSAR